LIMIIVVRPDATEAQIQHILDRVQELGFTPHYSRGEQRTIIGAIGDETKVSAESLAAINGVEQVLPILKPFKLASRDLKQEDTIVQVGHVKIGGGSLAMIAGPCAVESYEGLDAIAGRVRLAGANILRGGAFKPRTSPYSFQGHKEEGLKMLAAAREATGLAVVTEVMAPEHVPLVAEYADVLQVGARNMQNYPLLEVVGESELPVLLKRGPSATMDEFLLAAEYILKTGNRQVMLCERGIRTFETYTRNTFDISAIPVVQQLSHLPVIADPSHGTGRRDKVASMARAAVAAGADGLIIEVHHDPDHALSDGAQSLIPSQFDRLMAELRIIAPAIGRSICLEPVARRGWGV